MAGGWASDGAWANLTDIGTVAGSSTGTTLTSSVTPFTKGSYTTLVASTTHDACALWIGYYNGPSSGTQLSFDVAVGGAGSEQVILPDVVVTNQGPLTLSFVVPLHVAAGTRISARCMSTVAFADSLIVFAGLIDGEYHASEGRAMVDTYGFTAASIQGTTVDPGATPNTKGAYAQLTASTSNDLQGLWLDLDTLNVTSNPSTTNGNILMDVAVGGAGSEQVIVPNLPCQKITTATSNGFTVPNFLPLFNVQIPLGSRIAVRCQSTASAATSRLIGVTAHGVRL
jgi:hypothetical protein